jgi:hypothetical protein
MNQPTNMYIFSYLSYAKNGTMVNESDVMCPPSASDPNTWLLKQKLIPHNGHKYIQEERGIGGSVFVSEIAKPYHMHNLTQLQQSHDYTFISNPMPKSKDGL